MIFVIEDDPSLNRLIGDYFVTSGHEVTRFTRAEDALAAAKSSAPDLVLTDVQLPGMSGVQLVTELVKLEPKLPCVVMTAHGSVQVAVDAMRAGAFEFVEKPVDLARLVRLVNRTLAERKTERELAWARGGASSELLGQSPQMLELRERIATLSRLPAGGPPLLVQGETGVGKGAVARALHRARFGEAAPWIEVNCAALPATLIESELFGHERSAFTDAKQAKAGLFEAADGGTLFLDELGELPLDVQAKLLKVLESGVVRRVGGLKDRTVRVAVIAASNVDLEKASRTGRFRADLYHRLAALPLFIPPLRERGADVVLLARAFVAELARRYQREGLKLTEQAERQLQAHSWPGNVRELKFAIERAVLLAPSGMSELSNLPGLTTAAPPAQAAIEATASGVRVELPAAGISFEVLEKAILERALALSSGNVSGAARLLELSRDTLRYRLKKHGLESYLSSDEGG
jgi:DNA-binding NtrC family response regulator